MSPARDDPPARSILVRAPNWLGDVVMATPALRALRAGFPDARIAVHLRPGHVEVLEGTPWIDELIPVASYHAGLRALLREGLALRPRRFDLGLCFPDSLASAVLLRATGIRRRVGYARRSRSLLLTDPLPPPGTGEDPFLVPREQHELGIVAAVGCAPCGTHLELFTTPEGERAARELLEAAGIGAQDSLVGLAPGASFGPSKLWPAESFAEVGDALADEGHRVVLLGGPGEAHLARAISGAMRAEPLDLTGRTRLGALKSVVSRLSLLVCNDAGARHVAVAFGVPCVVPMGPTALEKTAWNLERVSVLTADDVDCRPCYLRECPIDHRCMTRITPAHVLAEARARLRAPAT